MAVLGLLAVSVLLTAAASEPLAFSNATDGRSLATLSSDTLTWTGCRDAKDAETPLSGAAVSAESFTCPSAGDAMQLRAVPGTALVNLVLNGSFPGVVDPYLDTNLAMFPDVSGVCPWIATKSGHCPWKGNDTAAGRSFYTFWWRTEFTVEEGGASGEHFWLHLRGINYRVSVFLNGVELSAESPMPTSGDPEQRTVEVAAMYHRFVFDASTALKSGAGTKNVLAILVKPPDAVGTSDQPGFLLGGGQGGDHGMAQNGAVMQYAEGWDWAVGTADRNTGLWDMIQVERISSLVTIRHPRVDTVSVSLNSGSGDSIEGAVLAVSATLQNLGQEAVSGELSFQFLDTQITGGSGKVEVAIPAGGSVEAKLPQLTARNAALWWPQPLGDPVLHRVRLDFVSGSANTASTARELRVGLRTAEAVVEPNSNGRSFLINGKPIFLAGGNWIGTDQLLRYSTNRQRYYDEVRMHKEMGMNIIRVWGGASTERPEFYDAADELGMLVMQEFWMTGDNNGRWAGSNDWPNDHPLYLSCVVDMMRMLRNHPSLLFWCGGNELLPPKGTAGWQMDLIDHKLRSLVSELDGTRFYIPSSMGTYKEGTHNNSFSLAPSDGPYNILDPQKYYTAGAGGGTVDAGGDITGGGIVFQPETGNIATPTYASMQRFLSPKVVADFPKRGADPEGHVNGSNLVWNYHKYITSTEKGTEFDHIYMCLLRANMSVDNLFYLHWHFIVCTAVVQDNCGAGMVHQPTRLRTVNVAS
jgi:mannosylglycoprotein endo-beta-mannosidase